MRSRSDAVLPWRAAEVPWDKLIPFSYMTSSRALTSSGAIRSRILSRVSDAGRVVMMPAAETLFV